MRTRSRQGYCESGNLCFHAKKYMIGGKGYMLLNIFIGVMIVAAIAVGIWMAWFDSHGGKK